jgi:hypothetical protein
MIRRLTFARYYYLRTEHNIIPFCKRPSEKSGYLGVKSSMAPSIQFIKSIYGDDDLLKNRKALPEAVSVIYLSICLNNIYLTCVS